MSIINSTSVLFLMAFACLLVGGIWVRSAVRAYRRGQRFGSGGYLCLLLASCGFTLAFVCDGLAAGHVFAQAYHWDRVGGVGDKVAIASAFFAGYGVFWLVIQKGQAKHTAAVVESVT
jgi:hypothetical protein